MLTAEKIIERFDMKPLPDEGGFYVETYRASELIQKEHLPRRYSGARCYSTDILYLITQNSFSKLHRVRSDEIFHFHLGSPVTMLQLHPDKSSDVITIGADIFDNQRPQVVVPRGTWQGCFLEKGDFALMSCTVAPGFEFDDYESASRSELLDLYPAKKEMITKLTHAE